MASNDASVSLNYKLGMRAKGNENLSLEETLAKRTEKTEDGSVAMIIPSKKEVEEVVKKLSPEQQEKEKKILIKDIEKSN